MEIKFIAPERTRENKKDLLSAVLIVFWLDKPEILIFISLTSNFRNNMFSPPPSLNLIVSHIQGNNTFYPLKDVMLLRILNFRLSTPKRKLIAVKLSIIMLYANKPWVLKKDIIWIFMVLVLITLSINFLNFIAL